MQTAMLVLALLVKGTVINEGSPLPGTTVTLTSASGTRAIVSNDKGEYQFDGVEAGACELKFELPGLKTVERHLDVKDSTVVPPQELKVNMENVIVSGCGVSTCDDERPASRFDLPFCADEALHTALIESIEGGDRSALGLLRQRYETADSSRERHRLAGALLRHLENDGAIWDALAKEASIAVRFPHTEDGEWSQEFQDFCRDRNEEPEDTWWMSVDALLTASVDPRSRTLLHGALKSGDDDLVRFAVGGFAIQRDASALPAIAEALERLGEDARGFAGDLAFYAMDEADALAFKYIPEDDRETYLERRREISTAPR